VAEADSRTGVGELTVLSYPPSAFTWMRPTCRLAPSVPTPTTVPPGRVPSVPGHPTAVASIRREHVEAFIAAELERTMPSSAATATARYSSSSSGWTTRARSADRRWPRCVLRSSRAAGARPTGRPGPGPLAACSGKDFRDRRYAAIIRLFVDTGCGSRAWADWGTAPTISIGLTGPAITSRAHHREGPT
jgi:hypothetical protein